MTESNGSGTASEATESLTFGRREMLRRGGFVVGAAALWATPLVQTVGMRPAAATEFTLCPREGQVADLRWEFRPVAANNVVLDNYGGTPAVFSPNRAQADYQAADFNGGPGELAAGDVVKVVLRRQKRVGSGGPPGDYAFDFPFQEGQTMSFQDLNEGQNAKAGAFNSFEIFRIRDGEPDPVLLQKVEGIHTSCSQDLEIGFTFSSLRLLNGTPANG